MRHYKKGRKLGTDRSHTKAMKCSLVCSLFFNDRIITIESRAKEIRGDVDKIIGWAKRGDLHSRRLAIAALGGDKYLVAEIFDKVSQGMFSERNSGYTRIIKLGHRKGDNAPMVMMELINEGKKKSSSDSSNKKGLAKKRAERKEIKSDPSIKDSKSTNSEKHDKNNDTTEAKLNNSDELNNNNESSNSDADEEKSTNKGQISSESNTKSDTSVKEDNTKEESK